LKNAAAAPTRARRRRLNANDFMVIFVRAYGFWREGDLFYYVKKFTSSLVEKSHHHDVIIIELHELSRGLLCEVRPQASQFQSFFLHHVQPADQRLFISSLIMLTTLSPSTLLTRSGLVNHPHS
jgi:hypothetical protein